MKGKRVYFLMVSCVGAGLLAVCAMLLTLSAATGNGLDCSVPGHHDTIQGAINDLSCHAINVGVGTFDENVTISRTVTIQGSGASSTTVFGKDWERVFTIQPGVVAVLGDMTVTGGPERQGGGIYNEGTLQVTNSVISGC